MSLAEIPEPTHLSTLAECEAVIERGLHTFAEVGDAITKISIDRLYLEAGYDTFDNYCRDRWQIGRAYGYRMMTAAATYRTLVETLDVSPTGDTPLPVGERQLRPLASLPDEQKVEAWTAAVEIADGQPTAAQVEQAVAKVTTTETTKIERNIDLTTGEHQPDAKHADRCACAECKSDVAETMLADLADSVYPQAERDVDAILKATRAAHRAVTLAHDVEYLAEILSDNDLDDIAQQASLIARQIETIRKARPGLRIVQGGTQ